MSRPILSNITPRSATVTVDGKVAAAIDSARDVADTLSGMAFPDADGAVWVFTRASGDFAAVAAEEG